MAGKSTGARKGGQRSTGKKRSQGNLGQKEARQQQQSHSDLRQMGDESEQSGRNQKSRRSE